MDIVDGIDSRKRRMGIYIHIPFCVSKCIYCDFLSFPADDGTKERYVDALCREIREAAAEMSAADKDIVVPTVFFGGGTPSILHSAYIVGIMNAVRDSFCLEDGAEVTIECNPGTLTREKLDVYKYAGINRLSIGLQSPDNHELKNLGRIHTYEQFRESYITARLAGFDNINIDVMSAVPYQTVAGYEQNLRTVASFGAEHISAYSLIVEENTPLYNMVKRSAKPILPSEEEDRQMYALTKDILEDKGYARYEISNYAKPGYECRHNISYWDRTEYIGFGLAAASLVGDLRYTNTSDIVSYLDNPVHNRAEEQKLTLKDKMEEFMFLGLRMMRGVSRTEFTKEFGKNFDEVYGKTAAKHIRQGVMYEDGDRLHLTDIGIDISNSVMAEYLL